MAKVPNITPLGANANADDYAVIVQGGVTKKIRVKNLFTAVNSLSAPASPSDANLPVFQSGELKQVPHENLSDVYRDAFGLGSDWMVSTAIIGVDLANNRQERSDFLGGLSLVSNAGTPVYTNPTATTPFIRGATMGAGLGSFFYQSTESIVGQSGVCALFAGVDVQIPLVNCFVILGLGSGVDGALPPQQVQGKLQLILDSRRGPNWHLSMDNGVTGGGYRSCFMDTGLACTSGYQIVGIVWDPYVGLHFVRNRQHVATLVPQNIGEYLFSGVTRKWNFYLGNITAAVSSYAGLSHVVCAYQSPSGICYGEDDYDGLTVGNTVVGENPGTCWGGPYVESAFAPPLGDESFDAYTVGNPVVGENGGSGWSSAFTEPAQEIPFVFGDESFDGYTVGAAIGGSSGGSGWVDNWSESAHI